ncbi:MAG: DMT family transporter [Ilumatobacteraceae bacterium]
MSEPWGPHARFGGPAVGSVMALLAGSVWSFGAVTARLADGADAFQYLLWRSVGIIVVIEGWRLIRRRSSHTVTAFTSGPRMVAANACLLLASLGFVYAVKSTSASTAVFLGSTTPLFGVLTARVFLGERANWRTMSAIVVAFVGLYIMVSANFETGDIIGNLAALTAAIGFAGYTTIVRSAPDRDWSPVLPGYSVWMIAICAVVIVAHGDRLAPAPPDVAWALLHGALFIVGGTFLYNGASKHVPASAMTVFVQSEMVLVPVWAFLVLAERPAPTTLVGGALILVAVVGKAWLDHRFEQSATIDRHPTPGDECGRGIRNGAQVDDLAATFTGCAKVEEWPVNSTIRSPTRMRRGPVHRRRRSSAGTRSSNGPTSPSDA